MNFLSDSESQAAAENVLKTYAKFLRSYKERIDAEILEECREGSLFILKHDKSPENISMFQLLDSENKLLSKILIVFFYLNQEAKKLNENSKHIVNKLMIVEDDIASATDSYPGDETLNMKRILKFSYALDDLVNMKFLIQNSIFLSVNMIHQFCSLFSLEKHLHITPDPYFNSNLSDVGTILKNLMIFDILFENSSYKMCMQMYEELIYAKAENNDDFKNLQTTLHEVLLLLDGNILQIAIDNIVATKGRVKAKALKSFEEFMLMYIKNMLNTISIQDNNISELDDTDDILKLNMLILLYQQLFQNLDPKHLRLIIEINNKYPAIIIQNNIIWNGNEFLKKHIASMDKSNLDVGKVQQNFLTQRLSGLHNELLVYSNQVALFVLRMHQQSKLGNENITEAMLKTRCELFYHGLTLAGEISFLTKSVVNLYAKFGKMLSKPLASVIYKFVENLKIIKSTYEEKAQFIADSIGFVFQYLQFHALNLIGMCKKKVMMAAKKERKFDLSTTLVLIEKLLYGTVSVETLASINLALSLTEAFKNFGNEYSVRLLKLLDHMSTLCHLEEVIKKVCDPSFLFWHQNLITAYFKSSQECHLDQHRVELMLKTADECTRDYYNYRDIESLNNFNPFILQEFQRSVLTKACNSIEINLRLDFHSNLQKEKFNPLEIGDKLLMEDNRSLLTMKPVICSNEYILIRTHVENYLSKMFYNLTTISLKDWRTYEEMRRLAEKKYSLETISDHLPTQTLDHGIDLLQIMKNIHLFVSSYNYNLNNQIFVESSSHQQNSQHYNTIRINNIAQSLVTRGNGVINTITNYVYQFLRKKLFVLSKVVYDERIKSRLMREIKLFRENLSKGNDVYGFDRAHILNRDIKKLETFEDGKTLLDKIRDLITQIGNLLGFMRMIKSGISHVNSNSISFVPTHHMDDNELEFLSMCKEQKLSAETIAAAKCFQDDIEKSTKGITEGSPHLKLLFSTLASYFQNSKNSHMRNFYIFVPALTIGYIEHILISKDRLNKKNKSDAAFSIDGFAMGIVYILKLLDQLSDYNSLNWITSVKAKIKLERDKVLKQRSEIEKSGKAGDGKLMETLMLSEKRIGAFETEFDLLFFNLNSVKIFFQK